MPYFRNEQDMLEVQRVFFDRVASDPEIGPQLQASKLIIRFVSHDPAGTVTIDCHGPAAEGRFFQVTFGEGGLHPDITLTTSADLGHEFWLGRANIVNALFSGKAKASGDVSLAMKFLPALKPISAVYREVLAALNRPDLLPK
jgi:SCP-2 sterol transfer family